MKEGYPKYNFTERNDRKLISFENIILFFVEKYNFLEAFISFQNAFRLFQPNYEHFFRV